jgi:hypothetical protein
VTAKARELTLTAIDNGWAVLFKPEVDTGGSPFVTVEGARGDQYFNVCWHTRGTGTYRIFHASLGASRHTARDASLKRIVQAITGGIA